MLMSEITNPASPGRPSQVVAQSTPTQPLAGNAPWGSPSQHPALAGFANTADAQIQPIPQSVLDAAGGPTIRRQ
jgi:hypothetical protein